MRPTRDGGMAASSEVVAVPWRPGNADAFQMGTPAEHGARAAQGELSVTLYRPPVRYCEQMKQSRPRSAAPVAVVVYP
jgi:hypothetical protein